MYANEESKAFFHVTFFSTKDQMIVTPTARKKKAPTTFVAIIMPQTAAERKNSFPREPLSKTNSNRIRDERNTINPSG